MSSEMLVSTRPPFLLRSFSWYSDIDFFRDAYVGDVDAGTGFALVATPQACFVWQHTQELVGVPTCYIFPCPADPSQAAPLYAFVPYGGSREPGLILASQSGEVWFWNNIGVGLAGGEQYSKILLELQSKEIVNSLTRLDVRSHSTVLMSTQISSASNLRCINLSWALVPVDALYLGWKVPFYSSPFLAHAILAVIISLLAFYLVFTIVASRCREHRRYCPWRQNESWGRHLGTCRIPCPKVAGCLRRLGRAHSTRGRRCGSPPSHPRYATRTVPVSGSRIT